ncbi:MAG: metallophosphoesterase family protein [Siculibacillus sp.]
MRLAVVSDLHGNLDALEAVVADLAEAAPDLVINLGDCLSGPLDAAACCDRLIDLGWPTVRGNHDRQLLDRPIERMGLSDAATRARLAPHHLAWLAALPTTLAPAPGILAFHGAPDDDLAYVAEEVSETGTRLRSPTEIATILGATEATLLIGGHTHVPRLIDCGDGRRYLNPGSIGLPAYEDDHPVFHVMETGSPDARYAVIDLDRPRPRVAFRHVAYDPTRAVAAALAAARDDWAEALATGFRRGR